MANNDGTGAALLISLMGAGGAVALVKALTPGFKEWLKSRKEADGERRAVTERLVVSLEKRIETLESECAWLREELRREREDCDRRLKALEGRIKQ